MSVVVDGLCRRFQRGGPPAVGNVSFSAPDGAITTLLGPSGSGKTTVLRIVAGLEVPDAGSVCVDGRDCTRVPVRERRVGFVFQGYALFPHMSVRENVAFGLEARRVARGETRRRVDELLSLVQLGEFGDRRPSQLSGGQQQRIAFARALATEPRVLLLDEPFGALDARVRVELREWLLRLHEKTHLMTLLVTHDQDEAPEVSQHVVVMHEGRVQQAGAPQELYDRPATPFVASFLGGASALQGRVEGGRAAVAGLHLAVPAGARDGDSFRVFVRPRDVRIAPTTGPSRATNGLVERLLRIGGMARLDVRLPSGEAVAVEVSQIELERLDVHEGEQVNVDLAAAKVFLEDYEI